MDVQFLRGDVGLSSLTFEEDPPVRVFDGELLRHQCDAVFVFGKKSVTAFVTRDIVRVG